MIHNQIIFITHMNNHKIDTHGNYLKFSGFTIISYLSEESKKNLHDLFIFLSNSENITKKYSLLPFDSYHMTICSITDQRKVNLDLFFETNKNNLIQTQKLINLNFVKLIGAKISNIVIENVISIYLELDDFDKNIIDNYSNNASEFIINKIPKYFHITLGYLYKNISDNERNEIKNMIIENFDQNLNLFFDIPKLCYYDDMTKFYELNLI